MTLEEQGIISLVRRVEGREISGTKFQGTIRVDINDLKHFFGEPELDIIEEVEWYLHFEKANGEIVRATICGDDQFLMSRPFTVGGDTKEALDLVREYIQG